MSTLSTHVLDLVTGKPASGVDVTLETLDGRWLGGGRTDPDGRIRDLARELAPGVYRITFATGAYFEATGTGGFYPVVPIVFEVQRAGEHHHVPLLLGPYGYSTYRGS